MIVGGEAWHGINSDTFDAIASRASAGRLVVVLKSESTLKIFIGDFAPVVKNKHQLIHTTQDQYHFHCDDLGTDLRITELPGYSLSEFDTINYGVRLSSN